MSEPLVTAIIPSRSGGAGLAASVAALAPSPDLEVVVVLNDADAETTAVADGLGDVTVLRSPVNRGFGGGVDLAAAAARSRVLLITHDDATIVPGSIERLVAAFERHDHLGAVAGAVHTVGADGAARTAYGAVVCADGSTLPVLGHDAEDVLPVDYAGTAMLAVRMDAYEAAGGFDPGYFPAYFTDVDLAFRLRASGWWVGCTRDADVHHRGGSSTDVRFRQFIGLRNRQRFLDRWAHALVDRVGVTDGDVTALLAHAAADRDRAVDGTAPRPATAIATTTGDLWFAEQAATVERDYRTLLEARITELEAYAQYLENRIAAMQRSAGDEQPLA